MEDKLPDNLKSNIQRARKRASSVLFLTTAFAAIFLFGASILILYISDRFWETPAFIRLLIQLMTVIAFIGVLIRHFRSMSSLTKDQATVLKLVQRYFPKLGDSLQGAVELSSGKHPGMSDALCTAAIKQVSTQTEGMNFSEAVSTKRRNKFLKYLSAALIILMVCCSIDYKALLNTVHRWAMPLANIDRYTFVNIADMDSTIYVEHGKDFEFPVYIDEASRFSSSTLKYKFSETSLKESPFVENKSILNLKGQTKPTYLHLFAGDSSKDIRVIPVLPPAISSMSYELEYPDYLDRKKEIKTLKGSQLKVLQGSTFSLSARTTGVLSKASCVVVELNDQGQELKRSVPKTLKVNNTDFSIEGLKEGDKFIFSWLDKHNFSNRKDREIVIDFQKDLEPFADITNVGKNNVLLESKNLPIQVHCEDDFGLKEIGVEYKIIIDDVPGEWTKLKLRNGQTDATSLDALYVLNPKKIGAPEGSEIHLRSIARDYYPERKWSHSAEYIFSVLSPDEHAQLFQAKMKDILQELEEIIIREELNKNKNVVLSQQDAESIDSEASDSSIDQQINEEFANTENLKELSQEVKKAIDMAKDNPLFADEEIKAFTESMSSMNKIADEMMPKVSNSLNSASKSQGLSLNKESEAVSRQQNLEEAVQEQEKILAELKKAQEGAEEAGKNAELKVMSERLKALSRKELAVSQASSDLFKMAPGQPQDHLKEIISNMLRGVKSNQDDINKEIILLKSEIYNFHEKTGFAEYQKVHQDMEKVEVLSALNTLNYNLKNNQTFSAKVDALLWAGKFMDWAKWLDPANEENSDGGEGQAGEAVYDEFLTALFDIIINEQELREDTIKTYRKKHVASYKEMAEKLADRQLAISKHLSKIIPDAPPGVDELLVKAKEFMRDAEYELGVEYNAGQLAVNAESGALEVLKRAFEEGTGA